MKHLITMALLSALALFSSCNSTLAPTGRGNVPPEIAGEWFAGSGGTSWMYDPGNGHFGAPNGSGVYMKLSNDGTFVYGVQGHQSLYGCETYLQGFQTGFVVSTASTLEFHPTFGRKKFSDSCVAKNNTEGPDDLSVWTYTYQLTNDGLYVEGKGSGTLTRL